MSGRGPRPAVRRAAAAGALASLTLLATEQAAGAHGISSRGDLPISKGLFIYAAAFAVAISFVAMPLFWARPALARVAHGRRWRAADVPALVGTVVLRVLGLALFALVFAAAWWGTDNSAENIAPRWVYVVFWVFTQGLVVVLGDWWRALDPWDTLAMLGARRLSPTPVPRPGDGSLVWSHWPAALGLLGFAWLELCYHAPDETRVVALAVTGYTVVVLAGAAVWGRAWLRTGNGFTVLFGLLAHLSPFFRDEAGKVRVRWPFSGLAAITPRRGTTAVVLVVLGGTTFDGVSRTRWWSDVLDSSRGWGRTGRNTLGLLAVVAAVAAVYVVATRLVARLDGTDPATAPGRYAHSLVPIAFAYSVAHYFSLVFFEGQNALRQLSDPLGRGWNLFGTADRVVDYTSLSTGTIAWVQTGAIVIGHVVAVAVSHDRALESGGPRTAMRSQVPLIVAMVGYTVMGLVLLLNA